MNLLLLVLHYSIAIVVWHSTSVVNGLHHKLTKRELVKTFGVDDHKHVPEYQLIKTVRKFGPDGKLKIMEFSAWNSTFEIELKPNMKLVSPKVVSVIRGENGTVEEFQGFPENVKTDCHYHGEVKSHGKIKAAVSSCRELMGVIAMEDHFLMLQTIPERIRHHQEEDHLIYKRQAALLNPLEHFSFNEEPVRVDLNEDENTGFCDVSKSIDELPASVLKDSLSELNSINYTLPSEAKLDSLFIFPQHDPITLEIGLFLDSKLYEHFDREFTRAPDQHLTDFALALINNVHVLYQQPTLTPNLDIVIVRFEMWKQQPSPLVSSVHKSGQAQTLLDAFCRYQARINPGSDLSDPGHWDHGVLLTGYDIYHMTSSVAGVAPVARMCDDLFACSLVEGLHLGRSFVLAHEMGHNMGMVHDGVQNQCGRSCCLMSAVNGAGKTTWSTCSVREFNAFLLQLDESGKGNCLRDPAVSIGAHDHLADGRLPGQRFTADQQCSYFWGRDYQVEIPNGRNMDDICRILWCGNSGSTISTAHPALEGSFCGPQKWCQEGICQPWKQPMKKPEVIHGGWSDWSSNQDPCPITPCQITGGISIKPQLRTCTEPAPNNGGRSCRGSNMRGIVCGKINSNCLGLTRQEFGDRLCTAIRNDPTRPDRQLSGKSFLHQTQACKIWCHVDNSELIRNKGQFPNGTPCGPGQYCVSGSCLSLSCNDKALVSEDKDCPPAKSKSSLAKWGPWSQWSNCPVTCAKKDEIPLQRRTRKCQAPSPLCDGKTVETRPCTPLPPVCEEYSSWTEWSQCTKSCGGGKMTRKRQCTSGENCSQKLVDIKNCGEDPCPNWNEWDHWSSCSASCGPGQRSRRRTCSVEDGCEGEGSQITTCVGEHCMEETWGEWLPCSVTCGIGFQLRERLCDGVLCAENSKQARTCNVQDCPRNPLIPQGHLWSQWSSWSPCSATCGEGLQKRTRTCITGSNCPVVDSSTQEKRCVLGPCPSWTPWGDWNAECSTCSVLEIRSRERECKISFLPGFDGETVSPEQCGGLKVEIQNCDQICKTSEVHKKIESETVSPLTAILPSPDDSEYGPWQDWLPCSVTCGGGLRERIRFCPEDKDCSRHGLSFELEECNKGSCEELESTQWTEWSDWSSCNVVCGGGRQFRSRKCKALFVFLCDGANKEEKPCNTDPCGASSQRASGVPTLLLDENEDLHPKWSSWSSWSRCSCFTLTQFRRRFCQIQDPTVQGFCAGSIIDQRKCEPEDCAPEAGGWSEWSSWSRCSKECGSPGHQIRNRMCSDPLPSNRGSYCIGYSFDQKPCEPSSKICFSRPVDGSWTEWTSWSECSNPCENGQKSRTRYCSNPRPQNGGKQCLGSDFELKSCADLSQCNKSVDGSWSPWSSWSSCNGTCGVTFKSRSRTCSNPPPENGAPCSGLARQTTICNTKLCSNSVDGIWSTWSPWSPCTADCKAIGTRTRTRICSIPRNGGLPCFGKSAESQPCQPEDVLGESFCDSALRHEQALEAAFMTRSIR